MSFWTAKRVLVTGGAGLIGSHLVTKLVERGASVQVADDLSKGSFKNLIGLKEKIEFRRLDLLNADACRGILDSVDLCFHLAAKIGGIGYFHKYPGTSVRDNSRMSMNLWEEARKTSTKMVCVSSSMVFERSRVFPTPEKAVVESPPPITGYGFSKLFSEYLAKTYWEEFGTKYVIARPFNAYGPGEESGDYIGYSHVIPDLAKKILSGQYPLEILGKGNQTRSYTHVDDIADALVFVAEHSENDDFNIGTGVETSVLDLAKTIWRLCNREEDFRFVSVPSFEYDVQRRVPDISKITSLGWKARVPLEQGLRSTIQYLANPQNALG